MSSNATVRFGTIETTIIEDNGVMASVIETVHDYATTKRINRITASIFADSRKQMLTEVMKLTDQLEDDNVTEIAFECSKRDKGSRYKMQVSWTSK